MSLCPLLLAAAVVAAPVRAASDPEPAASPKAAATPAQEAGAEPAGPRLPRLVQGYAAPYPPEALAAGVEGEVMLEIDITDAGEVYAVRVAEPAGHGFDEAATLAALNFHFEPARDEKGRAVESRVNYLYTFKLDLAPTVSVEGTVLEAGTREPIEGATVVVEGEGGASTRTMSAPDGAFRYADLAPGTWRLWATAPGMSTEEAALQVAEGRVATVRIHLRPHRDWEARDYDEEMVVIGYVVAPEVSERALAADEIRVLPGTGGDIVRAVQNLPGVARTPFNAGQVMVRGTAPEDSGFYLGGARIPIVFHFGGLSTVVNGDSLGEVAFLPGLYGVRHGRNLGGVVDLRTDPKLPEHSHGYVSVDLFQATAFHRQRLGERWAVTLSGRRSYIDSVLAPIVNQEPTVSIRLPRYWDLQGRVQHRAYSGRTLDFVYLMSDDRFTVQEIDSDAEGGVTESRLVNAFQKGWLQLTGRPGGGWLVEHTFILGPERTEMLFRSNDEAWEKAWRGGWRAELYRPVPDGGVLGWRLGLDAEVAREEFRYAVDDIGGYFDFSSDERGSAWVARPGLYLEQTQRGGAFEGVPGLRVDVMVTDADYHAVAVDPRFALRWNADPRTTLTATVGRYSQFPELREVLKSSNGVRTLGPEWAVQAGLVLKRELSQALSLEGTVYHDWLRDLVVGHEDRFELEFGLPPPLPLDTDAYANDGTGRAYGLEALAKLETRRTLAWLGGSLSRSVRTMRPGEDPELFEYDQPVQLTAILSHALPRRWRLGARFRYTSGNPYTPVENRVFDLDSYDLLPVHGEIMGERMPAWWGFDFRVDKDFVFRTWRLTAYLDLLNATNRRNVEMLYWSEDWTQEMPVYGLPVIPAFGLRGEW